MNQRVTAGLLLLAFSPAIAHSETQSWKPCLEAGESAFRRGQYGEAERQFRAALKAAEDGHASDGMIGDCILRLAKVALQQGEYGRADDHCKRAFALLEKGYGPTHPEVARCLNAWAEVYRQLQLYVPATQLAQQGLVIREQSRGKNLIEVAESLETLARIFVEDSQQADVEVVEDGFKHGTSRMPEVLERAWAIREKARTSDPSAMVRHLLVWAAYYSDATSEEGRKAGDRVLQRAQGLVRQTYGEEHPLMAECLTYRALMLRAQHQLREAAALQRQALAIGRKMLGPDHPALSNGLRQLAEIEFDQQHFARADDLLAESVRVRFAHLNDADLCRFFRWAIRGRHSSFRIGEHVYEEYLTEMVRRGGVIIEDCLERHDEELRAGHGRQVLYGRTREVLSMIPIDVFQNLPYADDRFDNLEVFTALRRTQKKCDPLQIVLRKPVPRECVFPEFPTFTVALKNLDSGRREVGFTDGGDYRSGRQARWCFLVEDARGKRLPIRPQLSGTGGGLFQWATLKHGESWNTTLDSRSFVDIAFPGEYRLEIHYHDQLCLADMEGWGRSALTICRSQPIQLTVRRRPIQLTVAEQEAARKWVKALDEKGPVKVVAGTYGPWAHKTVNPGSPAGRLLGLGWKAVPTMLDELNRADLTPRRRAWILALLFSITNRNDPRLDADFLQTQILGDFDDQEGAWQIAFGRDDEMSSGGFGFREPGSRRGKIDVKQQREFARRWDGWKSHLDVRVTGSPAAPGKPE